jgi:hypothetical protein
LWNWWHTEVNPLGDMDAVKNDVMKL